MIIRASKSDIHSEKETAQVYCSIASLQAPVGYCLTDMNLLLDMSQDLHVLDNAIFFFPASSSEEHVHHSDQPN